MPDTNDQERKQKDIAIAIDSKNGTKNVGVGTADILAAAALVVAVIVAFGMVFGKIDGKVGAGILVALCGGAAIAKVVGAKGKSKG